VYVVRYGPVEKLNDLTTFLSNGSVYDVSVFSLARVDGPYQIKPSLCRISWPKYNCIPLRNPGKWVHINKGMITVYRIRIISK
jgi:hypothetical protein